MEETELKGFVDYVRFQSPDTGFTVATVRPRGSDKDDELRVVVGIMPDLQAGMTAVFRGRVETSRYGEQLKVSSWEEVRPDDCEGIERYLGSGLIKDIGPVLAHEIVKVFGEESLDIMDNHPERLTEVRGIGKKRAKSIAEAVGDQLAIREVMIWMKRYCLPNGLAMKIYRQYGKESISRLQENPYKLADDFEGIGFKKSDMVALSIGIPADSRLRITSGIIHVLREAVENGSTCVPEEVLLKKASSADVLGLPEEAVKETLDDIAGGGPVVVEDGYVYLHYMYVLERRVAGRLSSMAAANREASVDVDIAALEEETGVTYEDEQAEAIRTALSRDLMVLTGGPGTGKTVTTRAIIAALEGNGKHVLLAAPTGRAAKRMNEVTGKPSRTIHRLLEWQGGFSRNHDFPLKGDALIVDESSMVDTYLMDALLDAVPDGMKVVFVGDVDQLPSVGAGNVLKDMIDSGVIPTVRLVKIFRQAQDSDIVMNAHAVNRGEMPRTDNHPGTDFWLVERNEVEKISDTVRYLVEHHIPERLHFPFSDIQVLTPMRKESDAVGANRLNRLLQGVLNPDGEKLTFGETEFRVGDRVMQTRNDYEKGVYNGDMGEVVFADEKEGVLTVSFDGVGSVDYERADLVHLDLAYATTIHKSQGSEYPVVVMPLHRGQYVMLNRNLLYTGITRARKWCILVGSREALRLAVSREDSSRRYTLLRERLVGERPAGVLGRDQEGDLFD